MKKTLLAILSPLCLCAVAYGLSPKFDAYSRMVLTAPADASVGSRSGDVLDAFVSFTDEIAASSADIGGVEVLSEFGDILVVRGAVGQLEALASDDNVLSINISRPMLPANDRIRHEIGADVLATAPGYENTVYTGRGVLAGLYDIGFDLQNPAFRDGAHSRVRRLWHYFGDAGKCTEYSVPVMLDAFTYDAPQQTHGSHVLGTMAGRDEGKPYGGMAPGAALAVACGTISDTNIALGVAEIAKFAASEGMPCVINLSIADFIGPHDGTDPLSRALTAVAEDAVVVVSAGNEHTFKRSLSRRFSTDAPAVKTFIRPEQSSGKGDGTVAVWSGDQSPVRLTLVLADTQAKQILASYEVEPVEDGSFVLATSDFTRYVEEGAIINTDFSNNYTGSYVAVYYSDNIGTNGRPNYYVSFEMKYNQTANADGHVVPGIIVEGVDGHRVDITLSANTTNLAGRRMEGWTDGGDELSISSMACADGVLSVGAYVSRTEWTDTSGNTHDVGAGYTLGDIAPWSSRGTTVDGRTLPHVAAPGAAVVSVLSSRAIQLGQIGAEDIVSEREGVSRTDYWGVKWGTSMSSPAVAGGIALWLEADPSLTARDVLDIVAKTSRRDAFVGRTPEAWGSGTFDVVAGMAEVLRRKASLAGPSAVTPGDMCVSRDGGVMEVRVPGLNDFTAVVVDMSGRTVASAQAENGSAQISAAGFPRGVYIVTVGSFVRKVLV